MSFEESDAAELRKERVLSCPWEICIVGAQRSEVDMDARGAATAVLADNLQVDRGEAEALGAELEWFLRASGSVSAPLSPSIAVDGAWHALLAEPRIYEDFCLVTCGTVIRHRVGTPDLQKYERALAVLEMLCGERPERYWPKASLEVVADCDDSTDDDTDDG
jgi:hypothetical protein